ncbi:hypothetical protein [Sorangium sp. So ce1024]|uniref:hypothetical protein n=1 Tax=Sorangium sp. So ce1024 TaxID=3133327 RepID=UPI003F067E1C
MPPVPEPLNPVEAEEEDELVAPGAPPPLEVPTVALPPPPPEPLLDGPAPPASPPSGPGPLQ